MTTVGIGSHKICAFVKVVDSFITRYYCPPDTTITDYELDKLTSFPNLSIDRYNSTQNTKFGNVLVIKAMRSFSCGFWYYLTFQGSLPDHPPQMFEAKLYYAPPLADYKFTILSSLEALEDFVLKTSESASSRLDDKDSIFQAFNKNDTMDEGQNSS
ncbi:hypothetical protein POM88_027916 [Heracleum sosnowskyi]|uniref:Uncharacterized protein n=1 Tax=Heracleum sosnowskyi TaxID=360622 RepID=A0AAD8I8H3_9APIA|nr:hypothetical protein POM88_027916 [Heracleum sosnowskyi]